MVYTKISFGAQWEPAFLVTVRHALAVTDDAGWLIGGRGPNEIGIVAWRP